MENKDVFIKFKFTQNFKMNIFREIYLLCEELRDMNFVLHIAKTFKWKSIIDYRDGNDICSEIDERILILPN